MVDLLSCCHGTDLANAWKGFSFRTLQTESSDVRNSFIKGERPIISPHYSGNGAEVPG